MTLHAKKRGQCCPLIADVEKLLFGWCEAQTMTMNSLVSIKTNSIAFTLCPDRLDYSLFLPVRQLPNFELKTLHFFVCTDCGFSWECVQIKKIFNSIQFAYYQNNTNTMP